MAPQQRGQEEQVSIHASATHALLEIDSRAVDGWMVRRIFREHTRIDMLTLIGDGEKKASPGCYRRPNTKR